MAARQKHGFVFEDYIRKNHLDIKPKMNWDVCPSDNYHTNKALSIKCIEWKNCIALGDAYIQYKIDTDFELIVCFWVKEKEMKKIVNLNLIEISKQQWRKMWGTMTEQKIRYLDKLIKDSSCRMISGRKLKSFRKRIQKEKKEILKNYNGRITLNPKIDSKNQRRLQCSLSFKSFFEQFGLRKVKTNKGILWGEKVILSEILLE